MVELIPAFVDELEKLSATAEEKAQAHFLKPDWKSFEKNLRSEPFRRAVLASAEADPKLRKYVKNYGAYRSTNDVVAEIRSKDSGKTYRVKDLHNGRLGCSCKDWQYIHSVQGGDCKHIKSVKKSRMVKRASQFGVAFTTTGRALRHREEGKRAKKVMHQLYGGPPPKDSLLRALLPS